MTKFQKSIAHKLIKETRLLTWEQLCERMAVEMAIVLLKMKELL